MRPRAWRLFTLALALFAPISVGAQSKAPTPKTGGSPPSAAAQAAACEEAKVRSGRAVELFSEEQFKPALLEFERAYELCRSYKVLYNIGQIQLQLNTYADAIRSLEAYLAEGGVEIDVERRKAVEKDIATARSRTAKVRLKLNVPDAEIAIDEQPLGTFAEAASLVVDTGPRKIVVSRRGFVAETRTLKLVGGDDVVLEVSLSNASDGKEKGIRTPVIVGWSATAALAIGATVTGIVALSNHSSADDLGSPSSPPKTPSDAARQQSDARDKQANAERFGIAADILAGAALAAGAVSLYLTLRAPTDDSPRATSLVISPFGAGVTTRF